ncbi:MAG: hypothetical protein NTY53_06430 [Kiritimatiellaeota bacterium]|nr:hypothetical protein [Kiritimatiellota bacterium]
MKCFPLPLLLALALPLAAPAIEWRVTHDVAIPRGETLSNEIWAVADSMKIAGTAERSLFLQAQRLELAGRFQRDLWVLTDTLTFSGQAEQSVRVAAKRSAQFSGSIAGNLIAVGETVQIQKTAVVAEDAVLLGQEIIVEGSVSNRLYVLGNKVTLAGYVGNSARIVAEEITLMPGAISEGDLRYSSEKELFAPEGVRIAGKLIRAPKPNFGLALPHLTLGQLVAIQFALFIAALLVGLPFVALFPRFTTRAVTQLRTQPSKCMLSGAIALALFPMLAVMAALTWVGLPLGLLLMACYAILLYLAKIIVAIPLAVRLITLRGRPDRPLGALPVLVVGLFLLYLAAALPVIGFAVQLVTVLYGLGALVLALLGGEKGLPLMTMTGPRAPEPPPLDGMRP